MIDLEALEARAREFLVQCGPCDFGVVEYGGCNCPKGDPRSVISQLVELLPEIRQLREALAKEERDTLAALTERDNLRDTADALAEHVSTLTGVEIGEHSNVNNPWANALNAQPSAESLMGHVLRLSWQRDQVLALAAAAQVGVTQHCWCPEGDDGALKHWPDCKGPQSYWDLDPDAIRAVSKEDK